MRRMYSKEQLEEIVKNYLESGIDGNAKIFENIVDKQGHKRFIEGSIALLDAVEAGVTKSYGKWSLSGTHLLIVLGLDLADTTVISGGTKAVVTGLPQWVLDKIYPLFASSIVNRVDVPLYADDYSSQTLSTYLVKGTALTINTASITINKDRHCRIAYDLLIDDE